MNTSEQESGEGRLRTLLRSARPIVAVRPGFERQVWQRIESPARRPASVLDWLARWLLNPKFAAGALVAVVMVSGAAGAVRGVHAGDQAARHRYLASVDPEYFRP